MKKIIALAFVMLAMVGFTQAQNIAGTYKMNFKSGTQVYTDRTPALLFLALLPLQLLKLETKSQ